MTQEKLNQIEKLDNTKALQDILSTILKETGLADIAVGENIIEGTYQSPVIGAQNALFILLTDHLTRNYEGYPQIAALITKKMRQKTYNSIIIISSKSR